MVEVITYSLRDGKKNSSQYYREIAAFTDEVLGKIEAEAGKILAGYRMYIQSGGNEDARSPAEYGFELLTLGVLWQVYGGASIQLEEIPRRILVGLVHLRRRSGFLKPIADDLRGLLGARYLTTKMSQQDGVPQLNLENLGRLLKWLDAAGDFKEEVKRIHLWRSFLAELGEDEFRSALALALSLVVWFEERALQALGRYTPNVDRFLEEVHPSYAQREDAIFSGRSRIEYHLNMVGSEVLNRAFREDFIDTTRKIVILPPCMRAKQEDCEARATPLGEHCAACTPGCRVHQVTKLGEKYGFDVFIMPHELSVFSNGGIKPERGGKMGIVGVSCPLTNVQGGWETKGLDVPAQGVLLDYCGCPWHWHPEGITTDINFNRLLQVLGFREA